MSPAFSLCIALCAAATRQWNCWAGGWHETCFMSPVAALPRNKRNVISVGRLRDCLDIVSIMSAIMGDVQCNVVDIFIQY